MQFENHPRRNASVIHRLRALIPILALPAMVLFVAAAEKGPDPVPFHKTSKTAQPAVISMHYVNAPMSKVLADFASQTGSDMGLSRAAVIEYAKTRHVSLDIDHADFWTALQVIQPKCGLHIDANDNYATLALEPDLQPAQGMINMGWRGPWQGNNGLDLLNASASHAGMLLFLPNSCMINRSVQYEASNSYDYGMSLNWSVLAEPKFRILRRASDDNTSATLQECVDDRGRSLLTPDTACQLYNSQGFWMWQMSANLRDLPDAHRITRVKGTVKFLAQTASAVVELPDISQANNTVRHAGPFTLTFHSFDAGNHRIDILFTGALQGWSDDEFQAMACAAELADKNGNVYHYQDCQVTDDDATHGKKLTITFNTPVEEKSGPAQKFHWEVATHTAVIATSFELHDLPLPQAPEGE